MKILYTDKYVEIIANNEKKCLDIRQKQKIQDENVLEKLYQNILYYNDVTKYNSIIFSVGDVDFSTEYNFFQDTYCVGLERAGIQNLLLVIPDDNRRNIYHQELQDFTDHIGLHVDFFRNTNDAFESSTQQVKKIFA